MMRYINFVEKPRASSEMLSISAQYENEFILFTIFNLRIMANMSAGVRPAFASPRADETSEAARKQGLAMMRPGIVTALRGALQEVQPDRMRPESARRTTQAIAEDIVTFDALLTQSEADIIRQTAKFARERSRDDEIQKNLDRILNTQLPGAAAP